MTWVKLCGMTRAEDVAAAVDAGADAVGFVIYPGSPRFIALDDAARLAAAVGIGRFLVAVDAEPGWLIDSARDAGMSGIQPHGSGARAAAAGALAAGLEVLYPVVVTDGPPDTGLVPAGAIPIFDTGGTGLHGGSGTSFRWELTRGVGGDFVVAGGLTPESVAGAVAASGAWGVDVSSGVESAPGIKDHELMRRFVEAVK